MNKFIYRVNATMVNHVQVDVESDYELPTSQIKELANKQIVREFGHSDEGHICEIQLVSRPTPVRADVCESCENFQSCPGWNLAPDD